MNSDKKRFFRNLSLFLLFWVIAILLAFCAGPGGGGGIGNGLFHSTGSGGTKGFGSAEEGKGPGAGEEGIGKGKDPQIVQMGEGSSAVTENKKQAASASPQASNVPPPQKVEAKNSGGNVDEQVAAPPPAPPPAPVGTRFVIRKKKEDAGKDPAAEKNTYSVMSSTASGAKGFFGAEVSPAGKVLFLIDASGSMGALVEGMNRLDRVKVELQKVIKNAGDGEGVSGHFLICRFESSLEVFPKTGKPLKFSSSRDRKRAFNYLKDQVPGGGTNMLMAWKGLTKLIRSAEIDTVYFLSDGAPGDCNEQSLCQYLRKNFRRLKINTFFMTIPGAIHSSQLKKGQRIGNPPADLMKSVADQHRGVFRVLY